MSNRDLFSELSTALTEAREHSEGKLTLRTHHAEKINQLNISPMEIVKIREMFNMSRGLFAQYLHTSVRTLESWEQGRSKPNAQAITLLQLVQHRPETLSYIADL